jgi:acyl-coenzyme A thioesterase PaaI-like protein
MSESWRTRLARAKFNLFPSYRGTGGRVRYVRADWREIRVEIPYSWRTRNYMGTTFGGSIYGACDPMHAMLLIKNLDEDEYAVWDTESHVDFEKPGETDLYARFVLPENELDAVRDAVDANGAVNRTYEVDVVDADGVVHATVENVVHVSRRDSS